MVPDSGVGRRWASPDAVLIWPAVAYGLGMGGIAVLVLANGGTRQPSAILVWVMLSMLFGGPLTLLLGTAAWARERWVTQRAWSGAWMWWVRAVAVVIAAHWWLMLAWTPLALIGWLGAHGSRADDYFASALAGLVGWVSLAVGGGIASWIRWNRIERRPVVPRFPTIPDAWITALLAGALLFPVGQLAAAYLRTSWNASSWLVVVAVQVVIGGVAAYSHAAGTMARLRQGLRPGSFNESFTKAASWIALFVATPIFLHTLLGGWQSGTTRFALQLFCVVVVTVAVGWAWPRSAPPEPV